MREDDTVSDDTYLMLVDGEVRAVDLGPMMRRHRVAHVEARAAAVAEVADLAASKAFDLDEVCQAGTERFGADAVDAALDVVYELAQVEQLRE